MKKTLITLNQHETLQIMLKDTEGCICVKIFLKPLVALKPLSSLYV